jgi:predicted enzyme related to lactoylglutathione lyase
LSLNLNQVTVPSVDVARAVEFYQRLGLIQMGENLPKYARFVCPDGNSTFSIHQVGSLPAQPGVVVYFECDQLDAAVARLKDSGIVFDSAPQDQPWLWREAYLSDPDGNVICLYSAGDNRLNPPWRLK